MIIRVGNLWAEIISASPAEVGWLDRFLSVPVQKNRYVKTPHGWDGKFHFLRKRKRSPSVFPSGMVKFIQRKARKQGVTLDVADLRKRPREPGPVPTKLGGITLHEDQIAGVQRSIESGQGILWFPTGSGKTEVACAIIKATRCDHVFFVHRIDLLHQFAERFHRRTGITVGRIGEGMFEDVDAPVVAVTLQTAYARLKDKDQDMLEVLQGAQGVFFDECHLVPASTFYKVAMRTPNAFYRIGLSGTPLARDDARSIFLIAATGPVLKRITVGEMVEKGVLSRPTIRFIPVPWSRDATDAGTWAHVYRDGIVRNRDRNLKALKLIQKAPKPCLVFVREIEHGRRIVQACEKLDLRVKFVWGDLTGWRRREAVKKLQDGRIEIIVSSVVFQEGVDIPELQSVINCSAGKSTIGALQRLGRGLRRAKGKETVQMWDFYDAFHPWLLDHSEQRKLAYLKEGLDVREAEGF